MITRRYQAYLVSDKWKQFQRDWLADPHTDKHCIICHQPHFGNNLQFHHITYVRIFREKFDDVVLACKHCHQRIHQRFDDLRAAGNRSISISQVTSEMARVAADTRTTQTDKWLQLQQRVREEQADREAFTKKLRKERATAHCER